MKTSQPDLKDIVKEIKNLGNKIDKLEKIVETRLVGEEIPDKYEKALSEFERKRKTGNLEFLHISQVWH
jgi:hypothetical protein